MAVEQNDLWSAARDTSIGWTDSSGVRSGKIDAGGRYVGPVVGFADRVLRDFHDTYGQEPTPLFVDALDPNTSEPFRYSNTFGNQSGGALQRGIPAILAADTGQPQCKRPCLSCSVPAVSYVSLCSHLL